MAKVKRKSPRLPAMLLSFFWDYHFPSLAWEADRDLITARILACGDFEAVRWLRARLGDEALRQWLKSRRGGGLRPQQLRFWELVLGLPHRVVSAWIKQQGRSVWDQRRQA